MIDMGLLKGLQLLVNLLQPVVPLFLHMFAVLRRSNFAIHLLHNVSYDVLDTLKLQGAEEK